MGADADWLHYNADFRRTGYEVLGLSGQLISETLFPAPASFHVGDTEMSGYLLDTWRVSKRLQFNLGVRQDWDRRIITSGMVPARGVFLVSVRVGPHQNIGRLFDHARRRHDGYAGAAARSDCGHDAVQSERRATGPPALTTFTIGNAPLVLPRATNWTLDVDHQMSAHVYVTAKYLRRRGTDGFAFINTLAPDAPPSLLPLPSADTAGIYQLTNLRRDDYDSVRFSVRQTFSGQYEWMASYTHSRALSNAVLDPNTAQPLQVLPNLVPMPWDAPNRVLAWAYLPLPWKNWAISALADMRTGFPFSVRDQSGLIVGAVDSVSLSAEFRPEHRDRAHGHVARIPVRAARRHGQPHQSGQSHRGKQRDRRAAVSAIPGRRRPPFCGADPVLWPRRKEIVRFFRAATKLRLRQGIG